MGLAEKLGIGKSATFIAKVDIVQLQQVPLVTAKFRVKWKFKGSTKHHNHSSDEDDDSSLASSNTNTTSKKPTLLAPSGSRPRRTSSPAPDQLDADYEPGVSHESPNSPSTRQYTSYDSRTATPNPNKTPNLTTTTGVFPPTPLHSFSFPTDSPDPQSSSKANANANAGEGGSGASYSHPGSPTTHHPHELPAPKHQDSSRRPTLSPSRVEPKGATDLLTLRDHTVNFNREIRCPVVIPLRTQPGTSRYVLQPLPLRLAVRQEVLGDGGRKEEVKTGEVLLDLSQFVPSGRKGVAPGPKRFLLRQCNMNATLKVTVTMEWVDGERDFVAPQLTSGQIKGSTSATPASSLSGPPSIKSSASLLPNSRHSSKAPSVNGTLMRTDSSSSHSIDSVPSKSSLQLGSGGSKSKGWQPPSSSVYSTHTSALFGTSGIASSDRAVDIVEALFTRRLEPTPSESDFLSFSLSRTPRLSECTAHSAPPSMKGKEKEKDKDKDKDKDKEKERTGWFSRSSSSASITTPPTQSLPLPSNSSTISAPSLDRKTSVASSSSTKPRSVRWDDDEPPSLTLGSRGGSLARLSAGPPTRTESSTSLVRLEEEARRDLLDPVGKRMSASASAGAVEGKKRAGAGGADESESIGRGVALSSRKVGLRLVG